MGLFSLLGRIIGGLLKFTWKVSPWIARAIWGTAKIIGLTLIALFRGVNPTAKDVADYWLDTAVMSGLHTQPDTVIWRILYLVAIATIVTGWILVSYLTVWIIGRII